MYVERPRGLTAICIIAIILAILGFFALTGGLLWGFFGKQISERLISMMPIPPQQLQQQLDLQEPMYDEMAAMQIRWLPLTIPLTILNLVLIVLLIVAATRGLKLRDGSRKLLATAMIFAILFELGRIYPNLMIGQESQEISMRHTERVMQTSGNPAQTRAVMNMTKQAQRIGTVVGFLIAGAWLLAKLGYFGSSLWYLNRKSVKEVFDQASLPEPEQS